MPQSPIRRNALEPAHLCADDLMSHVAAVTILLDVLSRRPEPTLSDEHKRYLAEHLRAAGASLPTLITMLAPYLAGGEQAPDEPVYVPVDQDPETRTA